MPAVAASPSISMELRDLKQGSADSEPGLVEMQPARIVIDRVVVYSQGQVCDGMRKPQRSISPDGKLLAASPDDCAISLWNTQTGSLLASLPANGARIR